VIGLTPVPPTVLILQDRSASMADNGKWDTIVAGTPAVLATLAADLAVGWLRFPEGKFDEQALSNCLMVSTPECQAIEADGGCKDVSTTAQVPVGPLSQTASAIQTQLQMTMPDGETPTRWAIRNAYQILKDTPSTKDRHLILLTDGIPQVKMPAIPPSLPGESNVECGSTDDLIAEVKSMAADASTPVKTYVVGIDVPNDPDTVNFLSALAIAGQTSKAGCGADTVPCYHGILGPDEPDFQTGVTQAFREAMAVCHFKVFSGNLSDQYTLRILLQGTSIGGGVYDPTHTNGWDYDGGSIAVYGPPCEILAHSPGADASMVYNCK
jgi:hypothetical protein